MSMRHLLFEASGLFLAARADLISTVHENLRVQPVAGTRHWFRGLAVAQGKLLPISDLGTFCGLRCCDGHTLELSESAGMCGLQVDRVIGLSSRQVVDVPLDDAELPFSSDDNLALGTRAIIQQERVHRVLDVAALLQSPVFLNIAETET